MKKMKKILLLLFSLLYCHAFADTPLTKLVFVSPDGVQKTFSLNDHPRVTFVGTDLVILVNDVETRFPLSDIQKITYVKGDLTGDNRTTSADITYMINIIESGQGETNSDCDLDGDNKTTIADLKVLLNQILSK